MARKLLVYPVRLKPETIASIKAAATLAGSTPTATARMVLETIFDGMAEDVKLGIALHARVQQLQQQGEPQAEPV